MSEEYKKVNPEMIPCFNAIDFPDDVEEDCIDHDISVHCATELVNIYWWDEGGPLVEWLKVQGIEEVDNELVWIGVWGT